MKRRHGMVPVPKQAYHVNNGLDMCEAFGLLKFAPIDIIDQGDFISLAGYSPYFDDEKVREDGQAPLYHMKLWKPDPSNPEHDGKRPYLQIKRQGEEIWRLCEPKPAISIAIARQVKKERLH